MRIITTTIAAGANTSAAIPLFGSLAIVRPSAWTTAALTFQVSHDGGTTWSDVWSDKDSAEYSVPSANLAAGRATMLEPVDTSGFAGCLVRLRSGTSGTPVNQVAATTITLIEQGYTSY